MSPVASDNKFLANKKLLLVNVEPEVIHCVTSRVTAGGCEVVTASAQEGFAVAQRERPAVIMVDFSSSAEGGRAFVRQVEADIALKLIPLIALATKERMADAMMLKAIQKVILKPFQDGELISEIGQYVTLPKRILLVDDEPEFVALVEARLQAHGYEVIKVQDGLEALSKAKAEKPDLMILDLMMPKMDGYNVCRLLKFDVNYATIPIIMLTARSQEKDQWQGKKCGADAYICKPFKAEELLETIGSLLKKSTQQNGGG